MAPRNHADDFKDLEDPAARDFDPEDESRPLEESSDAPSDEQPEPDHARDHYQSVGKSRLRKRDIAALGPQYAGSRISRRDTTADDEEHDPFAENDDDDESEDSQDGFLSGEDDVEESQESQDGEDRADDGDEDEADATDNTSLSDEEGNDGSVDRSELRRLMNDEPKSLASSIAQATAADAAKGRAVKRQRQTFDSLLNTRIRLQHGLIANNSLAAETGSSDPAPYEAAETAALKLLDTLSILRKSVAEPSTGTKRKRTGYDLSTPSSSVWKDLKTQDEAAQAQRRSVLQKWSKKTASASTAATSGANRLNPTAETTILDVLDNHLAPTNTDRLIARTKMPRSCAPVQQLKPKRQINGEASDAAVNTDDIYDDADFYGVLLKELLESRNANASVDYSFAASNTRGNGIEDEYKAARQAKTHSRPGADRKASKGRKMRYTVHEKLQNYMAPEDRGEWGERQREELFGSLFGRKLMLDEDAGDVDDRPLGEEEALMLFRS